MKYIDIFNQDESFVRIETNNRAVVDDLYKRYSFEVDGARFMPSHKARGGKWDGFIRLFNAREGTIYKGLVGDIVEFLKDDDYGKINLHGFVKHHKYEEEFDEFINNLVLPEPFTKRLFQIDAAKTAIGRTRALLESPTSSGKSMIIYMVSSFLQSRVFKSSDEKILIVVPSVTLVDQMEGDFRSYGFEGDIHLIAGGTKKDGDAQIYISTWQSIQDLPPEWFEKFKSVIVDEVHLATAKKLCGIVEKCRNAVYRFGFSGTLKEATVDQLVLRGLFGKAIQVISIGELMEQGIIAKTTIEMRKVKYSKKYATMFKYVNDFDNEQAAILSIEERDEAIFEIIEEHKDKNIIVLFNFNKHGKRLITKFKKRYPERPSFLINGTIGREERKEIRHAIDQMTEDRGAVLFATYKTLSTGVSIKNLDIGIFAHPMKSKITIMQSLGRLLRISSTKWKAKLYDIWDDFTEYRGSPNFYRRHAEARFDYYNDAGLPIRESVYMVDD